MTVRIAFTTADGEEREEEWPSVERFRSWAVAEGLALSFTAYVADEAVSQPGLSLSGQRSSLRPRHAVRSREPRCQILVRIRV
jgi:hypothetical protein